jgi:hypothetical protein
MAAIGVSSIVIAAGICIAFLVAPQAGIAALATLGLALIATGFIGLLVAALLAAVSPPSSASALTRVSDEPRDRPPRA